MLYQNRVCTRTRAYAILTTCVLKNSSLTFILIQSYASISGAAIIPANFVKTFSLFVRLSRSISLALAKITENIRVFLVRSVDASDWFANSILS